MKNCLHLIGSKTTMTALNNKVALVTGATGGLGRSIINKLTASGVKVFITGRNANILKQIEQSNKSCLGSKCLDLQNTSDIKRLAEEVKPDILINCAGVFPVSKIEDTTEETFNETFNVNVRAPFVMMKSVIPHMKNKQWGRIVNIASSSAYAGFANTSVYCASKHALLGLTRSAYSELKEHGIRVYSFSPGSIKTKMGELVQGQDYDTFMEPDEISDYIVNTIKYDGNMIAEEVRLNRMFVQ
mgnify:CR=1 FL=1